MIHYMDTDSSVIGSTEGSIPDKQMDLSNLDTPIKVNNNVHLNLNMNLVINR